MQQSGMDPATTESEQPKYKRMAYVLLFALLAWIGGWIAAGFSGSVKIDIVLVAACIGGFFLLISMIVNFTLLSQAKLNDLLRSSGFVIQSTTSTFWKGQVAVMPEEINDSFRTAANVGTTGRAFRAAVRTDERGELWFIRHVIQQGKTSTIRNIFIMRGPAHWPRVFIHRKSIVDSVRKLFGGTTIPLENTAFNEKVSIVSSDADFATLLMGPELQELALSLKFGDELIIGGGATCLVTYSAMTEKAWTRSMEMFESALAAIPPELAEWQPAANTRSSIH